MLKNIDGSAETIGGDFAVGATSFELVVDAEQIITCAVYNSFVYAPGIHLEKVDSPTIVRGDLPAADRSVTSTYTVTNTGNTPLGGIDGSDTLGERSCSPVQFVGGDTNADERLDLAETWTYTCTVAVDGPSGSVGNQAEVFGTSPDQVQVSDTDDATVSIVHPAIELEKLVAPAGSPSFADSIVVAAGTSVDYRFTATNVGDTDLTAVAITDPECDAAPTPATVDLAVGASQIFTCTKTGLTDAVVNTATVTATPEIPGYGGANPPVTDTDTAQVETFSLDVVLTKSVDLPLVFAGTPVTYTYTVELGANGDPLVPVDQSGTDLADITTWVVDDTCASPAYVSGDDGDEVLGVGESWIYECTQTIDEADVNVPASAAVVNRADVSARSALDPSPTPAIVSDHALAVVRLLDPVVEVTKQRSRDTVLDPPATCAPNTAPCGPILGPDAPTPRTVDYAFEVRNPGTVPLDLTDGSVLPPDPAAARLTDTSNGQPVCAPAYDSGDDGNGYLDPQEVWTFTCADIALTKADTSGNGFDVVDVVEVTGTGIRFDGGTPVRGGDVQASDTAQVQVITPNLTLTKTPSATLVRPGTPVTFTYAVENVGDPVGFTVLGVVDDQCDGVTLVSGDAQPPVGNGILQLGETWLYECTRTVESPDDPETPAIESEVVNNATVTAVGPLGNLYERSASATVLVFDPAIDLVKLVSDDWVAPGTEVEYSFIVTNAGDDPGLDQLDTILLGDVSHPAQPTCTRPALLDDADGDSALAVGESWTFTCSAVIDASTVDVAATRGTDIGGGYVHDAASAYVGVYNAGIAVVKVADPTEVPLGGGAVTYTYEVTNTGDVPLAGVQEQIVDDTCAPVTYVAGDEDGNGLLTGETDLFETGPPEVWTFECTTTITVDTVNIVTVSGTPIRPEGPETLGPDVSAEAVASVLVVDDSEVLPIPVTPLPRTGSDPVPVLRIALALVLAGAVLVLAVRRGRAAPD